MRFRRVDGTERLFELIPEGEDIRNILLAIATHSYQTAQPRGLGLRQPYQASVEEVDLEAYIQSNEEGPVRMALGYIHGRDCRTMVFQQDKRWYFQGYAFEQRNVTPEEFCAGIRREDVEKFLGEVAVKLSKKAP